MSHDEKAARLADEARAALALAARAVWDCLRYPRSLLHLVRFSLPKRGGGLSADEVAALRALISKGGA